jgi:hypothetical protein
VGSGYPGFALKIHVINKQLSMDSIYSPFESQAKGEKGGRALENSHKIRIYGIFYSDCKFANRICE